MGTMEDYRLVTDLVLALGAAFLGGLVARRLGQPVLLGYIVAGVLIGPNTPRLATTCLTHACSQPWQRVPALSRPAPRPRSARPRRW